LGTPRYIAPEQARRSKGAVPQSDIYAWGVVLYEMLTGTAPFDDPSPTSLALQHLTTPPPPPRQINPALNEETEAVLLKALSKSPADRYQTGSALMVALEGGLRAPQTSRTPGEVPPPSPEFQGRLLSLSREPVADQVARYVTETHTPPAFPEPMVPATQQAAPPEIMPPPPSKKRRRRWGVLASGVLIGIAAVALLWFALPDGDDDSGAGVGMLPTASATAEAETLAGVSEETATETASPVPTGTPTAAPSPIPTVFTPTMTTTPLPTATLTASPSRTVAPSPTSSAIRPTTMATPLPTVTPSLTPTAITPTMTATSPPTVAPSVVEQLQPTVSYSNGRRFILYYNENSLYLQNLSGERVTLYPFAFERLDASGTPSDRFDGWRWADFYPYVHDQSCTSVLLETPHLDPALCKQYNAEVWAERGLSLDFWTPHEGSTHFRVLWNDQEVARCEIAGNVKYLHHLQRRFVLRAIARSRGGSDGQRFMLYYDENSLYLHNLSGERVTLYPFAFERLDASGTPSNRFDGWRWAQFFPYVHDQSCTSVLLEMPYLDPASCEQYNAEIWAERGRSLDFWSPQAGSTYFRVLWNDQEIARCEIAAGECEVFLP
jgi:hypothetical protein